MSKLFSFQATYEYAVNKEHQAQKWQEEIKAKVVETWCENTHTKIGDRKTGNDKSMRKDVTIIIDEIYASPSNYATKNLKGWTISMRGRKLKKDGTPSVYRETLFEWIKEDDI